MVIRNKYIIPASAENRLKGVWLREGEQVIDHQVVLEELPVSGIGHEYAIFRVGSGQDEQKRTTVAIGNHVLLICG
jgi:hypothetical protein